MTATTPDRLVFEEAEHRYFLDGSRVPSVTQVLEDVGIIDYDHIPNETRQMALERGRLVHAATHMDDEGDLDDTTLDPILVPYVDAWRLFRAEWKPKFEAIEHRGWNEQYRFAGTMDRKIIEGTRCILDIKTNNAEWWVAVQTAAYASFEEDPRSYTRLAVELHKDGKYRVDTFRGATWFSDFQVFVAALSVYNAKRRTWSESGKRRS